MGSLIDRFHLFLAFENVRHLLSSEDLPYGPSKGQKMHIFQRQDEKASLGYAYVYSQWQSENF